GWPAGRPCLEHARRPDRRVHRWTLVWRGRRRPDGLRWVALGTAEGPILVVDRLAPGLDARPYLARPARRRPHPVPQRIPLGRTSGNRPLGRADRRPGHRGLRAAPATAAAPADDAAHSIRGVLRTA